MPTEEPNTDPLADLSPKERAIYDAITRLNSWLREFGTTVQPQFAKDLRVVTDAALDYLISQREAMDVADAAEKVKELGKQIHESLTVSITESVNSSAREYVAPTVAGIVTSMMEEMLASEEFLHRLARKFLDIQLAEIAKVPVFTTEKLDDLAEAYSDPIPAPRNPAEDNF
jgi:NAD-specific glutamate dehydrogenase